MSSYQSLGHTVDLNTIVTLEEAALALAEQQADVMYLQQYGEHDPSASGYDATQADIREHLESIDALKAKVAALTAESGRSDKEVQDEIADATDKIRAFKIDAGREASAAMLPHMQTMWHTKYGKKPMPLVPVLGAAAAWFLLK